MDMKDLKLERVKRDDLLNQKIYKILKYEILEGNIEPGTILSEIKLAEQLKVSRTPIREAIKCLNTERFVKTIPGYGTVVKNISVKDLKEILQIRGSLEGLAASLAIEKITEKEIEKLSKLIAEMEICSDKKDIDNFSKYSQKFQKLIVNISGNDQLIRIRNNLSDQTIRYRIRSLSSPKRLKHSLKEHQDIFEAIKNKDSEKVEKLSKIHTENVFKNILAHIKNIHNNKELK